MIRYALACIADHEFEAWFSNSSAYDVQRKKGQVECPVCGTSRVRKQITAPAIRSSGEDRPAPGGPPAHVAGDPAAMAAWVAGEVRRHIADTHEYVGERFADEARAMHAGEKDAKSVWGEVSPDIARELIEEGVPALPLPAPFAPDPPKKRRKLN